MKVQKGEKYYYYAKMKWKNYVCYFVILLLLGTAVIVKPPISKAEESEVNITLLGTADIHGRFMPWDYALDGANMSGSLTTLYGYKEGPSRKSQYHISRCWGYNSRKLSRIIQR